MTTLKDCRDWSDYYTSPKDKANYLVYLAFVRDSAERGLGCTGNHHLRHLVESIFMNVGELYRGAKVNGQSIPDIEVGAIILLGARESRVQGEGSQSVGNFFAKVAECQHG